MAIDLRNTAWGAGRSLGRRGKEPCRMGCGPGGVLQTTKLRDYWAIQLSTITSQTTSATA